MSFSFQRIIGVVFLFATTISAVFIVYTIPLYFTAFRAFRTFSVSEPSLQVRVLNASYVSAMTFVTVQNPSELTFELRQAVEALTLNGEFILAKTLSLEEFIQLGPKSNVTLTIDADVHLHKTSYVIAHLGEIWLVELRIFLGGPLVEQFSWYNAWRAHAIIELAQLQTNVYQDCVAVIHQGAETL